MYNTLDLLNALGCVEMSLYLKKYNKSLVRDFYANLTGEIENMESPFRQVYKICSVIAFSPANIANFLSCPHYTNIELTSPEGEIDWDDVAKLT